MKKFVGRIADHLLDFVVSTVISLIGTYIATCNFLDIEQLPKDSIKIVVAIFMLILVVCVLCVRFCRNAFRHKYRIRTLEVVVEYLGDKVKVTDVYSVSTYRVFQSMMYTSRTWFSNETLKLKAKPKKYKIKKIRESGNKHEYYVVFPEKLSFWNKPITFKTELTGGNKSRQFENYYCYDVVCPVDKLIFDVRIPANMCTLSAEMKSFKVHEDESGAGNQPIIYNCGFKHEISNPKVGYSYMLKWQWAGEEQALRNKKQK